MLASYFISLLHLLKIGNLEEACPFKEKYWLSCCWITHILLFRHRASLIVTEKKTDRDYDFKEWFHISAEQYCKEATCLLGDAILVSVLVKANRTKRLQTSPCDELETSRLIFFSSQIPNKKKVPHSFVTAVYFWGLLAVVLLPVYFVLCYVFNHFVNWTVILPKAFLSPRIEESNLSPWIQLNGGCPQRKYERDRIEGNEYRACYKVLLGLESAQQHHPRNCQLYFSSLCLLASWNI